MTLREADAVLQLASEDKLIVRVAIQRREDHAFCCGLWLGVILGLLVAATCVIGFG